ncbi:hypothetical protein D3C71_1761470 [compost metagenome]
MVHHFVEHVLLLLRGKGGRGVAEHHRFVAEIVRGAHCGFDAHVGGIACKIQAGNALAAQIVVQVRRCECAGAGAAADDELLGPRRENLVEPPAAVLLAPRAGLGYRTAQAETGPAQFPIIRRHLQRGMDHRHAGPARGLQDLPAGRL